MKLTKNYIDDNFKESGDKTPARGVSYIHKTKDECATVYNHKIRLFKDRIETAIGREKWPCFYGTEQTITF